MCVFCVLVLRVGILCSSLTLTFIYLIFFLLETTEAQYKTFIWPLITYFHTSTAWSILNTDHCSVQLYNEILIAVSELF